MNTTVLDMYYSGMTVAQPYRDFTNNIEPSAEMRRFARWVNHKAIFKSVATFADYTTKGV